MYKRQVLRGSAQNPDIFFQAREACNPYYDDAVEATVHYMDEVNSRLGTDYKPCLLYTSHAVFRDGGGDR